jgi:hypothetical protein
MFVDGHVRDQSFQRNTGYVMQQDIHLSVSTVRETLEFSAMLRQPPEYTKEEKLAYVDEVIHILEMEDYADAIVGVPGSGLNVERTYTGSAPVNHVNKLSVSRTQAPHDRCRARSPTETPTVPRRAYVWLGLANLLVNLQLDGEAHAQWSSDSVHYSSTFLTLVPALRSAVTFGSRGEDGLLR